MKLAFWGIVVLGFLPFYDVLRPGVCWPSEVVAASRSRVIRIRLSELIILIVYLTVALGTVHRLPLFSLETPAAWAGLAAAAAGAALAGWAKIQLRGGFSASLAVRPNHPLITTGPYARVRHPMYTGILLQILGGALVYNSGVTLLLLFLPFCGFFHWHAVVEEELLLAHFGAAYQRYQSVTGRLLPRSPGFR